MPAITPDIEATTQPIKGRRTMKKSKMSSKDGFKKFAPAKNAGSAKYLKQKIKGPVKGKMSVAGVKYGGA
jgi:hypothetical protein